MKNSPVPSSPAIKPTSTFGVHTSELARRGLVVLVILAFITLRVITSGPPTTLSESFSGGPALGTQSERTDAIMVPLGLLLLLGLLVLDRPLGFAFIISDMTGFGTFFDLDQWGMAGVFKFRDIEFLLLLALGIFWSVSKTKGDTSTRFGSWLRSVSFTVAGLALVYTVATSLVQPVTVTLRYSRQLYVWLLFLVVPQFIRNKNELGRVVNIFVGLIGLAASLYVAQTMLPPQTVLRYSQQQIFYGQVRVWSGALSPIFAGGLALFAFQVQKRTASWRLWTLCGLIILAVLSSQGRVFTVVFVASIVLFILYNAWRQRRLFPILRFSVFLLLGLGVGYLLLSMLGQLDPLMEVWRARLTELDLEIYGRADNFVWRMDMFTLIPTIVERNGGTLFNQVFGMGLRALTPSELFPMIFWGTISPPIWADNGLAGILFSAGYVGLALYTLFIILMLNHLWTELQQPHGRLTLACLLSAFAYFLFAPFYMLFSAHFLGSWDEALVITMLLAIAERATAFEKAIAIPEGIG
jgi:hypothetical protein